MKVSVEPFLEYSVQEITPDGQEILVRPPTVTEKLARLVKNADFDALLEQPEGEPDAADEESESRKHDTAASKGPAAVKSAGSTLKRTLLEKLRSAHVELCALCDVLTIAREGRQLAFDVAAGETQSTTDSRTALQLQLTSKKQALSRAAGILRGAAERLRRSVAADDASASAAMSMVAGPANAGALLELGAIRRLWRVRRVGGALLGDASFRHAGSRYLSKTGAFELLSARTSATSNWRVQLPDDDVQCAAPRFRLVADVASAAVCGSSVLRRVDGKFGELLNLLNEQFGPRMQPPTAAAAADENWCASLRGVQRALFAAELFDSLAAESRLLNGCSFGALHAALALDRTVVCALAPSAFLECALVDESDSSEPSPQCLLGTLDLDALLTLYTARLLRERHKSRIRRTPPGGHVATWNGFSAPGDALTFSSVASKPPEQESAILPTLPATGGPESTILERAVMLARALLVRGRLERFFDEFARSQRESLAATRLVLLSGLHASLIGWSNSAAGSVTLPACCFAWHLEITVDEYETSSTHIMLELFARGASSSGTPLEFRVLVTTKDGKSFETPIDAVLPLPGDAFADLSALAAFLLAQLANHHVTVVQRHARLYGLVGLDVNNVCMSHAGLAASVSFIVPAAASAPASGTRQVRVSVRLTAAAPFSCASHCVASVTVEQLESSASRAPAFAVQLTALRGATLIEKLQTLTLALVYGATR